VTESCRACAQVNPGKAKIEQGVRPGGHRPGTHWEIDFTEIKPGMYGHKYLLVFIDTFSGWVEAFPTKHEMAKVVTKKLLEEIFPRYGMPQVLGSDNGPAFVSQVSQLVAKLLGIDWKLYCAYRPQSSGQQGPFNVIKCLLLFCSPLEEHPLFSERVQGGCHLGKPRNPEAAESCRS